jgi:predicted ATPase
VFCPACPASDRQDDLFARSCSVQLCPLIFLVGQNGSGKSNFLDPLRLVSEPLNTSLDHALRERGGINEVRRRSSGHPTHFGIRLEFALPDSTFGHYAFRVGARLKGGFEVQQEECRIYGSERLQDDNFYSVKSGRVEDANPKPLPPASDDRLFLVAASSLPQFRPLYDRLTRMGFYNFNPGEIRDLQPPHAGEVLQRDGSNLASVLNLLSSESPAAKSQIVELLSKVVPGVVDVTDKHAGKKETLELRQKMGMNEATGRFLAENMSDGTLRALGVLTALLQSANGSARKKVPLVGIEEPEVALHPGAAGVLRDGLTAASRHTQVIVTSHSPDLLDDKSTGCA